MRIKLETKNNLYEMKKSFIRCIVDDMKNNKFNFSKDNTDLVALKIYFMLYIKLKNKLSKKLFTEKNLDKLVLLIIKIAYDFNKASIKSITHEEIVNYISYYCKETEEYLKYKNDIKFKKSIINSLISEKYNESFDAEIFTRDIAPNSNNIIKYKSLI